MFTNTNNLSTHWSQRQSNHILLKLLFNECQNMPLIEHWQLITETLHHIAKTANYKNNECTIMQITSRDVHRCTIISVTII